MMKSLIGKWVKRKVAGDAAETPQDRSPRRPAAPRMPESIAKLDLIVVPRSALAAHPAQADPLVDAVVDYVNGLVGQARFQRLEIPPEAMQAFHCDYYLAQVRNGGHAQFVGNSRAILDTTLEDVLAGLEAMGATDHLALARRLADWVADHPEEVPQQTGFEGGIAPGLAALDAPFHALDKINPLRPMIAAWIARLDILQTVDDAMMPRVMVGIGLLNPKRNLRDTALTIRSLDQMLSDPVQLGLGMAGGKGKPVEPLLHVGGGMMRDIEGRQQMAYLVQTVAGRRWGIVTPEEAALHAFEDHGNATPDTTADETVAVPGGTDAFAFDAPRTEASSAVGGRVSRVPMVQVTAAAEICRRLNVAAAVDLMLRRLPEPTRHDYVSLRSAGPNPVGVIGVSLLLSCTKATVAYSAIVDEHGARLLSEPSHEPVLSVSRAEIDHHRTAFRMDEAA